MIGGSSLIRRRHLAQAGHALAVRPGCGFGRRRSLLSGKRVVTGADQHARGHPLDVPLPRPDTRFVEVVEVEQHAPFRRGEQSEVGDVRIAADHRVVTGHGLGGQVLRHHCGRAAVVGERRLQHPHDPHRHQALQPGDVLLLQDRHRVALDRGQDGMPASTQSVA
jgi:hypothetical protein